MTVSIELDALTWLASPRVRQLTYQERGAYMDLLCHMAVLIAEDQAYGLPDDDAFLARLLGIEPRRWTRLRAALVDDVGAPLYAEDGWIYDANFEPPESWGDPDEADV